MRILVLGGTVFLSEAVAAEGVRRGHDVVCACRGESGRVPDGAWLVRWDRGAGEPPPGRLGAVDAVVDVARRPSWVRAAVAAYPDAHWVLVSTVNVYADDATPGGRPGTTPLVEAIHTDEDLRTTPEAYGAMKVGCEEAVRAGTTTSTVIRPGLICGPGDPSYRFGYWPERLAGAGDGEVLAGGDPADSVQLIDVRDLAAWIVTAAERRTAGTYDGVGPTRPIAEVLAEVAAGVGGHPSSGPPLTWVPGWFLAEQGVEPWSGEHALPLWLPRPAYDGMLAHDVAPSLAAGLVCRPVAETARDTLAWLRDHPDTPERTALTRARESEVLAAWHGRG